MKYLPSMTIKQKTKINSLESLLAEKERLNGLRKSTEERIEQHVDYFRDHYVELTVDLLIVPVLKKTFKIENILHVFKLDSLARTFSEPGGKESSVLNELTGLYGKTGWVVAAKLGISLLKKFFK